MLPYKLVLAKIKVSPLAKNATLFALDSLTRTGLAHTQVFKLIL